MDNIKVKKTDLLTKLQENREIHKKDYDESVVGYQAELVQLLTRLLDDAKEGKPVDARSLANLTRPVEHLREYDRTISMLKMDIIDDVELSEHEFTRFVLDEWAWKENFSNVSAQYKGK